MVAKLAEQREPESALIKVDRLLEIGYRPSDAQVRRHDNSVKASGVNVPS
jgi:hypothetical protein